MPKVAIGNGTITSSATPAINTDAVDYFTITALAVNITSMSSSLTGTPETGQQLRIAITGTATRTITWGASFEASDIPLPTSVGTTRIDILFVWNAATSKWRCVSLSAGLALASDVATLQASAVTYDELTGSQVMFSWPSSTALVQSFSSSPGSCPLWVAPFACEITYFAAVWRHHSYTQHDTNYLNLRLYKRSTGGTASTIVTKHTRTTGNGGEAITNLIAWNFNAQSWNTTNATFAAGEVLEADFFMGGTFTVNFPVMFTWKYRPL